MFPRGNFGTLTLRSNNRGLPGLCVQVHICWCRRYAVFLHFMFLDLTGLLGKVNLFSLSLRLFVSLQCLRRLVAGGVGASVTDPPLADVLSTLWSSGLPSTLTTRPRYSIFPLSCFPTLLYHFPESSLLRCSHLQPICVLLFQQTCQEVNKWVNMPQGWCPN